MPSLLIVGDQDTTPIRHVNNIGGDNHVLRAQFWVKQHAGICQNSGVRCNAQFKLVPNVGHDYKKISPRHAALYKKLFIKLGYRVKPATHRESRARRSRIPRHCGR